MTTARHVGPTFYLYSFDVTSLGLFAGVSSRRDVCEYTNLFFRVKHVRILFARFFCLLADVVRIDRHHTQTLQRFPSRQLN